MKTTFLGALIISKLAKECNGDGMFMCRRLGNFTLCGQTVTLSVTSNCQVKVGLQNLTVMPNLVYFYRNTISVVMRCVLQLIAVLYTL